MVVDERRARRTVAAAVLAATVTLSLAVGCTTSSGPPPTDDSRSADRQPSPTWPAPPTGPAPTTAPVVGPVLAVKIDNAPAARPQTGLDSADLVYVEQVEGGLSRLMAVYATNTPKAVGPVRSARESDLELLRQFQEPVLAFSGAQSKLLPLIDRAPLDAVTPTDMSGAYYRGTGRPAPHNLYVRPARLLPSLPGAAGLTTGFRLGPAPDGGTPETSRTVRYPAARFTFTWSGERDRWLVSMDGTPTVTADGARVAPATVVVQYVTVRRSGFQDFLGNNTPYTETVGSGRAEVLRGGRSYDVTWTRPTALDGTRFTTADDTPVDFAEGQVWVVFAKAPGA
ncbi:DUF3048 domain-containing protein [Streptomyces phaeofaciens]|uniref:DUF3048 domain-containing protein n=1 Tax=Streptomyces phaeofaciens TaxID=68254 RepID=UPI003687DE25